jgi:hypothetical protein
MTRSIHIAHFHNLFPRFAGWMGLLLLAFLPMSLRAQVTSDPYLEHFSIGKDERGHVFLHWVMRPGTTCEGINVMRSTNGMDYALIHEIPGICGGPSTSISYDYVDEMPVANYTNHYRLELGNIGTTAVRSIDVIALNKEGFSMRPSPLVDNGRIYFNNPRQAQCRLSLTNMNGITVHELTTNDEFFALEGVHYQPGMYLVRIVGPENDLLARGRILVWR